MEPRPRIAALAPYPLADLGVPGAAQLSQNESAFGPSEAAMTAAAAAMRDARFYPDPDWTDLRRAIAERHGIDPAGILCGAGSMELIAALGAVYAGPDAPIATHAHAYPFYAVVAAMRGAPLATAPERDLTADPDTLAAACGPETRLVLLANPGNPTGTRLTSAAVRALREALPAGALLVIDEAYGEFSDEPPVWDLVARGDVCVLRSFSKAHALAGMRCGWGLFPPAVAAELRKVLNTNNVSAPAQAACAASMRDVAGLEDRVQRTLAIAERAAARLSAAGLRAALPFANFVLAEVGDAPDAEAALRSAGVLVRGTASAGLPRHLRITVGTKAQTDRAVDLLIARAAAPAA